MKTKARGAERTRDRREADARRRAAMFWMLREAGASYAEIGRAADLSIERVRQICRGYGYQLHRRSEYTSEEPFMARLRRAGALLGVAERVGGALGSGSTPVELRFEPRSLVTVQTLPPQDSDPPCDRTSAPRTQLRASP
jgi:hypothetical protein